MPWPYLGVKRSAVRIRPAPFGTIAQALLALLKVDQKLNRRRSRARRGREVHPTAVGEYYKWSPDGSRVMFSDWVATSETVSAEIFLMNPEATEITQLTQDVGLAPELTAPYSGDHDSGASRYR